MRKMRPKKRPQFNVVNSNRSEPTVLTWSNIDWELRGNRVTDSYSALGVPALFRGVNLISSSIANLPINVFLDDDNKEKVKNHPASYLLKRKVNDNLTSYHFIKTIIANCLLHGNGYAYIERDFAGNPINLYWLDPEQIRPIFNNGKLYYKDERHQEIYFDTEIFHLKGMGYDGTQGYSVIKILNDTFQLAVNGIEYQNTNFEGNCAPPYYIKVTKAPKDQEAAEEYRKQFEKVHLGIKNRKKPAIVFGDTQLLPLSISSEDQEIMKIRSFTDIQIAFVLNLPPHKVGANITTSYGSLESENRAILDECFLPIIKAFETEAINKLLQPREQEIYTIEFNLYALKQADKKTEVETLVLELNNGLITQNEARKILGKPSVENGDRYRHAANIVFDDDEQQAEEQPVEQEQPAEAEDDKLKEVIKSFALDAIDRLQTRCLKSSKALTEHKEIIVRSFNLIWKQQAEKAAEIFIKEIENTKEEIYERIEQGI